MYRKFEALDEDKKQRILNAIYDEFSKKRFREASTDAIAANARISKGALFSYFGTKKQLYLYAVTYGEQLLTEEFFLREDLREPDLLLRLRGIFAAKMQLYFRYPGLYEFLLNAHTKETDPELTEAVAHNREAKKETLYRKVYDGIDFSLFKEGVDVARAISVIAFTVEGYSSAELSKPDRTPLSKQQYQKWNTEFDCYLSLLRKAFYREEQEYAKRH